MKHLNSRWNMNRPETINIKRTKNTFCFNSLWIKCMWTKIKIEIIFIIAIMPLFYLVFFVYNLQIQKKKKKKNNKIYFEYYFTTPNLPLCLPLATPMNWIWSGPHNTQVDLVFFSIYFYQHIKKKKKKKKKKRNCTNDCSGSKIILEKKKKIQHLFFQW